MPGGVLCIHFIRRDCNCILYSDVTQSPDFCLDCEMLHSICIIYQVKSNQNYANEITTDAIARSHYTDTTSTSYFVRLLPCCEDLPRYTRLEQLASSHIWDWTIMSKVTGLCCYGDAGVGPRILIGQIGDSPFCFLVFDSQGVHPLTKIHSKYVKETKHHGGILVLAKRNPS